MVKTRKNKSNHKKSIKFRKRGGGNTHGNKLDRRGNSNFVSARANSAYAHSNRGILNEARKHAEIIEQLNHITRLERKSYMDSIETNKEKWTKNLKNIPPDEIENRIQQKVRDIEQYRDLYKLTNNKRGHNYEPMFSMLDYLNYQLTQLKELKKNKIITTHPLGTFF